MRLRMRHQKESDVGMLGISATMTWKQRNLPGYLEMLSQPGSFHRDCTLKAGKSLAPLEGKRMLSECGLPRDSKRQHVKPRLPSAGLLTARLAILTRCIGPEMEDREWKTLGLFRPTGSNKRHIIMLETNTISLPDPVAKIAPFDFAAAI